MHFVESTTTTGSPDFVPVADRIAVFDNDGTLWSEQPLYFQALFIFDRIGDLAAAHPEWETTEPFASVLEGDMESALAGGEHALIAMAMATHAGMTTQEFEASVKNWMQTTRHPTTGKPYSEMVFQPMLELLDYLRLNDYQTFIVSGGGIDFMRAWADEVYGIPRHQIIGTSIKTVYEVGDNGPALVKVAELNFINDKEGKPVGIHQQIGRRPVMAFGNSDGDFQMLEWTTSGPGPRFAAIVHHDDPDREWAYDRDSHIGRLVRGLDEGPERGWTIISIRNDWNDVFP
jgi:phosphoserine phosphatase